MFTELKRILNGKTFEAATDYSKCEVEVEHPFERKSTKSEDFWNPYVKISRNLL